MTIVFQSSLTLKTSNPLRHLVWISPLTLLSLSYLLSLLPRKYLLTQLRSLDETPAPPLPSTIQPATITPDVAPPASISSQFSISSPEASQSQNTQELPPFSSFLSDVAPLLSRPNHLKLEPDYSALGRQDRSEYYTTHARRTKRPRFNQHLQCCLKPEFCKWEIFFSDSKRKEYTIQSTSLPYQRLVVPPQAITALAR